MFLAVHLTTPPYHRHVLDRLIITGSAALTDRPLVRHVLDAVLAETGPFILAHGACPIGTDAFGAEWARDRANPQQPYPPDWARYGRRAHAARDAAMVKRGAKKLLAFVQPHTPALNVIRCVRMARAAAIPTRVHIGTRRKAPLCDGGTRYCPHPARFHPWGWRCDTHTQQEETRP